MRMREPRRAASTASGQATREQPEVDAVAIEDPREAPADHAADPARLHRERNVLARGADAEVRADDEDRVADEPVAQRRVEALEQVLRHLLGVVDVEERARDT